MVKEPRSVIRIYFLKEPKHDSLIMHRFAQGERNFGRAELAPALLPGLCFAHSPINALGSESNECIVQTLIGYHIGKTLTLGWMDGPV